MKFSTTKTQKSLLVCVSVLLILSLVACYNTFIPNRDAFEPEHFKVSGLRQPAGMANPVIIESIFYDFSGNYTVYYDGSTTLPQREGRYEVTFDVEEKDEKYGSDGLYGGTLVLVAPEVITITTTAKGNMFFSLETDGSFKVDWGDGTSDTVNTHVYQDGHEKTITIRGLPSYLNVGSEDEVTAIDTSRAPGLLYLSCGGTRIRSLDIRNNAALTELYCYGGVIERLTLSNNTALTYLNCSNTRITELDLAQVPNLAWLECNNTGITNLDLSNTPELEYLECSKTRITDLDLANNAKLWWLDCSYTEINSLSPGQTPELSTLLCGNTRIAALDLQGNPRLKSLNCDNTNIKSLDLRNNPRLESLECGYNLKLTDLYCTDTAIKSLDISGNGNLERLDCSNTRITSLNLNKNLALRSVECSGVPVTSLDFTNNKALINLDCSDCGMDKAGLEAMFTSLSAPAGGGQLWYKGNPGSAEADFTIAENKNWTVNDQV